MTGRRTAATIAGMTAAGSPHADTAGAGASAAPAATDTTFYFSVALGLTWLALLPPTLAGLGVLEGPPAAYMAGAPLAVFSPTIAAVLAARREGGWPAVRAVFRGLRAWRVNPLWYVFAITSGCLVFAAGRAIYGLASGIDVGPWIYLPERPEHFGAVLFVPFFEENGWRGYALPRLIARHGAPRATATLGALWTAWHLPMFISSGWSPVVVLVSLAFILVGNVFYTWFYRRTGGSLLLAWLFHLGLHLNNTGHALPGNATPYYITVIGWLVLAIAVAALDRRAWEGRSPEAPGTPPAL